MSAQIISPSFATRGFTYHADGWRYNDRFVCEPMAMLGGGVDADGPVGTLVGADGWLWCAPTARTLPAAGVGVVSTAFSIMSIKIAHGEAAKVWALLADAKHDMEFQIPESLMTPQEVPHSMSEILARTMKACNQAYERNRTSVLLSTITG